MHSINILKYYYIFYGNGGVEIDTIEVEQKYIIKDADNFKDINQKNQKKDTKEEANTNIKK